MMMNLIRFQIVKMLMKETKPTKMYSVECLSDLLKNKVLSFGKQIEE